jgi:hypothetical protein
VHNAHVLGPLVTVGTLVDSLVTGVVVPLGPLMQGLLETPGLTIAGHLEHGRVKVVPKWIGSREKM